MKRKDFRAILVKMVENDLLDWELVGREALYRMSIDEIRDMIFENGWEDENCVE